MESNNDSSAMAKVFSTAELLENIILHVQPDYIPGMKCICKTWQEIISTSPSILSIIKVLTPEKRDQQVQAVYKEGSNIAMHPALLHHKIFYSNDSECRGVTLGCELRTSAWPYLQDIGAEFATRPFCYELHIHYKPTTYTVQGRWSSEWNLVRVKGGIRIGHLLKKCREISRELELEQSPDGIEHDFVILLREGLSEEDMSEFIGVNKLPLEPDWGGPFKLQTQWPMVLEPRKIDRSQE